MNRSEAIAILSAQSPEVREAAAVFVETLPVDGDTFTNAFGVEADGTLADVAKLVRAIEQGPCIDNEICWQPGCGKPATIAAWWESGVGYACKEHEDGLCKIIRPCPHCGNIFGVQ